MNRQRIGIIDYGTSNLHAVMRCMATLAAEPVVVQHPWQLPDCDRVLLPGVGHFGKAVARLQETGLFAALQDLCAAGQKPVLGICLGMQLLGHSSEESPGTPGLGHFDYASIRLPVTDTLRYKVPHIGWNTLSFIQPDSVLFKGLTPDSRFYFSHSFALPQHPAAQALTAYESPFVSVVGQGRVWGVQFHPEKSYENGLRLLQNFLAVA